jgi:hypothetical protein
MASNGNGMHASGNGNGYGHDDSHLPVHKSLATRMRICGQQYRVLMYKNYLLRVSLFFTSHHLISSPLNCHRKK